MRESLWLWWHRRHGEVSSATWLKAGEFSHVCKGCYSSYYRFSKESLAAEHARVTGGNGDA